MATQMIIGFTGKFGSGKTSAAKLLVSEYGFIRTRFADKLKRMLISLGLTGEQVDGELKDTPSPLLGGATPRWAMQTLGTNWGRMMVHPDIWVKATMHAIQRMPPRVVIDDLRYLNEADAIHNAGGLVIRVLRPGFEGDSHSSEQEMDSIAADHTVSAENLESLHGQLYSLMDDLLAPKL